MKLEEGIVDDIDDDTIIEESKQQSIIGNSGHDSLGSSGTNSHKAD